MPQCGQAVTMVPEVRSMLALRPTCCLDDRRRRAGRVQLRKEFQVVQIIRSVNHASALSDGRGESVLVV